MCDITFPFEVFIDIMFRLVPS